MRQWTLGLFLLASIALTGCVGVTTQHTATPIPKGDVEFGVVPGAIGAVAPGGSAIVPNLELALRYGISDTVDFGVKITGPLVTADVNVALILQDNFALSLDPTVGLLYFSIDDATFIWLSGLLPVLADVVKTDGMTVVAGAKVGYIYISASDSNGDEEISGSGDGFTLGATVGAKFRLSKNFAIMPSFDILTPTEALGDGFIYNVALGFHF